MPESSTEQLSRLQSVLAGLPAGQATLAESWIPRRAAWAGPAPIAAPRDLAGYIDHTILKATATQADVARVCAEAASFHFKSVCVNACNVPQVASALAGTGVLTCTVVGFPLGAMTTASKAAETAQAVADGADEIDMVINQGLALSGRWDAVRDDIAAVVGAADGRTVKVIIETCNLDHAAKVGACLCSALAGAHFVKTSTGFGSGGATADDIALMRLVVGGGMSVKASGGIRTTADALSMVAAGADRIGASASIAIIGA